MQYKISLYNVYVN